MTNTDGAVSPAGIEVVACVQHGNSWLAVNTSHKRVVVTVPIEIASAVSKQADSLAGLRAELEAAQESERREIECRVRVQGKLRDAESTLAAVGALAEKLKQAARFNLNMDQKDFERIDDIANELALIAEAGTSGVGDVSES